MIDVKIKNHKKNIIKTLENILSDNKKYLDFLKVIGHNHRYNFLDQVSIFYYNKNATACSSYEFWNKFFNRKINKNEKAIPILVNNNIKYIFDINQTTGSDLIYEYLDTYNNDFFNNIYPEIEIMEERIDVFLENLLKEEYNDNVDKLNISDKNFFKQENIRNFVKTSIKIALSYKLNITISNNNLDMLRYLSKSEFNTIGHMVSFYTKIIVDCIRDYTSDNVYLMEVLKNERLKLERIDGYLGRIRDRIWGLKDFGQRGIRPNNNRSQMQQNFREIRENEHYLRISSPPLQHFSTKLRKTKSDDRGEYFNENSDDVSKINGRHLYEFERTKSKSSESITSDDKGILLQPILNYAKITESSNTKFENLIIDKNLLEELKNIDKEFAKYNENTFSVKTLDISIDFYYNNILNKTLFLNLGVDNFVTKEFFTNVEELLNENNFYKKIAIKVDEKFILINNNDYMIEDLEFTPTNEVVEIFNHKYILNDVTLFDYKIDLEAFGYNIYDINNYIVKEENVEILKKNNNILIKEVYINALKSFLTDRNLIKDENFIIDDFIKNQLEEILNNFYNQENKRKYNYLKYLISTIEKLKEEVEESTSSFSFNEEKEEQLEEKDNLEKEKSEEILEDVEKQLNFIEIIDNNIENNNFKITSEDKYLIPSERLNNNLKAIKLLDELEKKEKELTFSNQEILSKYVGFGGLADVFDETKKGQWEEARLILKNNLTLEEYNEAKSSTLTAFYTPKIIIDNMYKILEKMNFKGENILEPSFGIGNFIGNSPFKNAKFYGTEIDSISFKIAKYLYPNENLFKSGFEKFDFNDNFFDLAISNIPFGNFKIFDKKYEKYNFLIHDYFFAKTLDKVKKGGIIAFITSSGTLDKKDNSFRKYINERAEFLTAIRLPNNAFNNQGTKVVSDIIFLKKRDYIVTDVYNDFLEIDEDKKYNKYFVKNPKMVFGNIVETTGAFGKTLTCISDGKTIDNHFNEIIDEFKKFKLDEQIEPIEKIKENEILYDFTAKNFTFILKDNKVFYKKNNILEPITKNINKYKSYIKLSEAIKDVIYKQINFISDEKLKESQKNLSDIYDDFVKKYGFIKDNKKHLRKDISFPLVSSLEIFKDDKFIKSDVFTKRTINNKVLPTFLENPNDALILSVAEKGKVDLDFIANITKLEKEDIIFKLEDKIFFDFEKQNYITADEFLSGDIYKKIEKLEKIDNEIAKDYIEKLKKILPERIYSDEINVGFGATWIPIKYYNDFMKHLLKFDSAKITYIKEINTFQISNKNIHNHLNINTYGTKRMYATEIIENCLNSKPIKIFDPVKENDKIKYYVNEEETMLANIKLKEIEDEFKNWIFEDTERRKHLEDIYNKTFNSIVHREFDGNILNLKNINTNITLREHQKNAIARILFSKNTLLGHVVGAGKTYTMIASAMEAKRLGLSNKSLFVLPKHIIEQFSNDFINLYPTANILITSEKDFKKENRQEFIAQIATGNYDAIIMSNTQFEKIPMSDEYYYNFIYEQIEELENSINDEDKDYLTVKTLQRNLKNLEKKLEKIKSNQDNIISFEELGIDRLYVDEAHYYKNLFVQTKMNNVVGIGKTDALKTTDMFMKCKYLNENNKNIIFATGTPISNSMTELYTLQRYLQYNELKEKDLLFFDNWAKTFAEITTSLELKPEGTGYQLKTRFSKFFNLKELITMFKEVADIKTNDVLNLEKPIANYETIITKPSKNQEIMIENLAKRADLVRNKMVDIQEDNMLKITTQGKQIALDIRLINENLPDFENSKVNTCIDKVFEIYDKTKENKSTQLIFLDQSTPNNSFNLYDDIKNKLLKKGILAEEIAFIHDAKNDEQKEELFIKMREGQIRVLLGSTQKMGAGTNVQKKLIAIHDLDIPWRPSDLEQRAGRIIRQGNSNKEVYIFRYITENTFDAYLFSILENKQKFISQIFTNKEIARVMEDIDESVLTYSEIKALATNNPLIKEKMDLEIEVKKLKTLEISFKKNKSYLENKIKNEIPKEIENINQTIENISKDLDILKNIESDFKILLDNQIIFDKNIANEKLINLMQDKVTSVYEKIGEYKKFDVLIKYDYINNVYNFKLSNNHTYTGVLGNNNIVRFDNLISKIEEIKNNFEKNLKKQKLDLISAMEDVKKDFLYKKDLFDKTKRLDEINNIFSNKDNEIQNNNELEMQI